MRLQMFLELTQKTLLAVFALLLTGSSATPQNFVDVKPSPQQVEWQDLEFGVIIHFGPNTFLVGNPSSPATRSAISVSRASPCRPPPGCV